LRCVLVDNTQILVNQDAPLVRQAIIVLTVVPKPNVL